MQKIKKIHEKMEKKPVMGKNKKRGGNFSDSKFQNFRISEFQNLKISEAENLEI
ncbi:Protein CBG26050 [Caenorhabditis briggsae]|uniref:Protein CBG26050 n=1 Tax=Caenorhabditis briggsae TaxID=6238 RepID=B6IEE4_CAEBR|nr:Protein CBG26050 [Caenorhabditis briggsae]CAR98274.1 Protein CBG26050 [Caenorhabditis briggsae]